MSLIALDIRPSYKRPNNDGKVTSNKVTYETGSVTSDSEFVGPRILTTDILGF